MSIDQRMNEIKNGAYSGASLTGNIAPDTSRAVNADSPFVQQSEKELIKDEVTAARPEGKFSKVLKFLRLA